MIFRLALFAFLSVFFTEAIFALDLTSDIKEAENSHKKNASKMLKKRNQRIERWNKALAPENFCYRFSDVDTQNACFGHSNRVQNIDARNILLGNCYVLREQLKDNGVSYACDKGVKGCGAIKNGSAAYNCQQCKGTRSWLAVYSLGSTIQCF